MNTRSYTKLFSTIVTSSLWSEDSDTRVVWVTMLALADSYGEVAASVPGLARASNVSREKCDEALKTFLAPDPDSRTKSNDGRRVEEIIGGWRLLNYDLYRELMSIDERKEYKRVKEKERRDRVKERGQDVDNRGQNVDARGQNKAEVEVEVDLEVPLLPSGNGKTDGRYPLFVADLNKYWDHTNTVPFSFGSPDGRAVKAFLKSNPKLTRPSFQTILQNRTRSDRVAHSEPIHRWLGSCLKYASGPLDEFNKPKSNGRNGMEAFDDADTVIARMAKGASVGH